MKSIVFFFVFAFTFFTVQSQDIEGTYANKWLANSGEGIEYMLTLDKEGGFVFNYIRIYKESNQNMEIEVRGTWSIDGHLLILNTKNTNNADTKIANALDLNKARFISVSPRNPKFNLAKPSLKFYESEIFYVKSMELFKTESEISAID